MKRTLVLALVLTAASTVLSPVFPITNCVAQVPSIDDTLRVVSTYAATGDTFYVDVDVANADTLGAFSMRVRFDPLEIEPLTDTVILASDTTISVEFAVLRGTAFEQIGGSIQEPGVMIFAALDIDGDTSSAFLAGSGPTLRLYWRAQTTATPQVTALHFENDPHLPQSWNTMTDFSGFDFIRPVLTDGTVTVTLTCECPHPGDMDGNGIYDSIDLNALIDILFFGGFNLTDPDCPIVRADWNADGFADALDLNGIIGHLFFGGPPPIDPCP